MQISLGAGSAPHGVIVGPDRAAWVTDGGQNAIARVDPADPRGEAVSAAEGFPDANLNTATFDRKGILWFTGQNGVYGRVDPATGKVEAWKAPKGVGPYGITTDAERRGLVRLARRRSHRQDRHGERRRADGAAAQAGRRPAPHLVGLQGHVVGELLDTPARSAATIRTPRPGRSGRCRRAAPAATPSMSTTSDKVWLTDFTRQRHRALRPGDGKIRQLSEQSTRRFGAAIARPPGRDVGRRIRPRPAGGGARLTRDADDAHFAYPPASARGIERQAAAAFGCTSAV